MLDTCFQTPIIMAVQISKGHPQTGVKRRVVGRVLAFHRRMIAADLDSAGGVQVREVRPGDLLVAMNVGRQRAVPHPDDYLTRLYIKSHLRRLDGK